MKGFSRLLLAGAAVALLAAGCADPNISIAPIPSVFYYPSGYALL